METNPMSTSSPTTRKKRRTRWKWTNKMSSSVKVKKLSTLHQVLMKKLTKTPLKKRLRWLALMTFKMTSSHMLEKKRMLMISFKTITQTTLKLMTTLNQ